MTDYNPNEIEKKWQHVWEETKLWKAKGSVEKPKYYTLVEFPYPSGEGLHIGHVRSYTAFDIISRKRLREGFDVLYPIGWDAFGLPAEAHAIKTGIHPAITTQKYVQNYRKQLKSLGIWFDWSREFFTTDPKYYKWTQWIFLKFLEKGLAYKAKAAINWCPKDKIGLANEEVVDGKCERCGTEVELRDKEQWMLKITAYAERLLKDLDDVDYPERVKTQQKNWIGKSEGALIKFDDIEVFTTRPDTIFGATFIAVAGKENKFTGRNVTNPATKEKIPVWEADYVLSDYGTGAIMAVPAHDQRDFEFAKKYDLPVKQVIAEHLFEKNNLPHPDKKTVHRRVVQGIVKHWGEDKILALKWRKQPWTTFVIGGVEEKETFAEAAVREVREETGYKNFHLVRRLGWKMFSEYFATHKDENRYADMELFYIQLDGPEKDELAPEEAEKHELVWIDENRITSEIDPCNEKFIVSDYLKNGEHSYEGEGDIINSGKFDGQKSEEAKKKITKLVKGEWVTKYKLRDWVFSRQRYWGEPIPVIFCKKCGTVPVPEKDLPVELPIVSNYQPTDTGESPLVNIEDWVKVRCPLCGSDARRETDVMPNWAGSSWYFLRYTDPANDKEFASKKALKHWMPVDWYNGGMEHTTLHLLYSRFWNKFLFDLKLVPTSEPYKKRTSHGVILAQGGEKMSKSKGNVVNPDDIIERFGADTLRLYEMFMGPFEQAIVWDEKSLVGPRRFLERVWKLKEKVKNNEQEITNEFLMHSMIKKVSEDIETMGFNTAVSTMMVWANELEKRESISKLEYENLLLLLAPFVPHIAEELWQSLGHQNSVHSETWPTYDESKLVKNENTYAIQINGKVRATLVVQADTPQAEIENMAKKLPEAGKWIEGKNITKIIVVQGKVINIVIA